MGRYDYGNADRPDDYGSVRADRDWDDAKYEAAKRGMTTTEYLSMESQKEAGHE